MDEYILIADDIQKRLDSGLITYEFACEVNDLAYEKYIIEGNLKENLKTKAGPAINNISKSYVKGMNARGNAVAKVVVKKPATNATPDVVAKYNEQVNKVKTIYKVGEIAALNLVAVGPFDWLAKAIIFNGMRQSNDPSDKAVMNALGQAKNKALELKNKATNFVKGIAGKKVTQQDKAILDKLNLEGLNIAKQADNLQNKLSNKPDNTVTESVDTKNYFDEIHNLIYENGELKESYYDDLFNYISNSDYNNEMVRLAIECVLIEL